MTFASASKDDAVVELALPVAVVVVGVFGCVGQALGEMGRSLTQTGLEIFSHPRDLEVNVAHRS